MWWHSMPSKIVNEPVGSGMTAHVRRRTQYDFTRPLTKNEAQELKGWFERFEAIDPIARARGLAERTLAAIEQGDTDADDFKPHVGMGWYSREILKRCDWLVRSQDRGDEPNRPLELAYEIGALVTEAQLVRAWNRDVEKSIGLRSTRELVNQGNRKADPEWRAKMVEAITAERGRGVTDACRIASQRFPGTGAWTTYRDNFNARKASDA